MKQLTKIFIFLDLVSLVILSGCKWRDKNIDYYNESEYYLKDSTYNQNHIIIRRIYINKYDSTRILVKQYGENQILSNQTFFHKNKQEGPFIYYFPGESKIWGKGNYRNDSLDGEIIMYYENGKIHKIMYFDIGKEVGVWKIFDSTGQLIDSIVH